MPQTCGMVFVMRAYFDADHAGDSITCRSRTGCLVYLNFAPVYCISNKQTRVETRSFRSEFIMMKHCTEYIRGLWYKLHMMEIPCIFPALTYGDNHSVLANTTVLDSTLKKKSQGIAYHFVCESASRNKCSTLYVNTHLNPADLIKKALPSRDKQKQIVW